MIWGFLRALACGLFMLSFSTQGAENKAIRNKNRAHCGFYLVSKENTTFGQAVTEDLDINELKEWLATNPDISEDLDLYAVGASFNRKEHKALMGEIKKLVEEHKAENPSLKDVEVNSIRRLADFLHDQRGIFAINADGTMEKLAAYNPNDFRLTDELKAELSHEKREIAVVGAPLLGKSRKNLETELEVVDGKSIKVKSNMLAAAQKSVKEPTETLKYIARRMRNVAPIREDLQKPTEGEVSAMKKKLVIPGILTFSVQAALGIPLSVVIPVTIVNALNSASTATFRTFLGNWVRRSTSFFPSAWIKQISMGAFFTADLFWAGAGASIGSILSFAGWVNLFLQKWPSLIFNSIWRTPYHNLVYRWEKWSNNRNNSTEGNNETRLAAGALEKFMSYIMTQFFIYSIITKDSLTSLVYSTNGLFFKAGELLANESLIMNLNIGHIAMLGLGTASLAMMGKPQLLDPIARFAARADRAEGRLYTRVGGKLSNLARSCITPFKLLFGFRP